MMSSPPSTPTTIVSDHKELKHKHHPAKHKLRRRLLLGGLAAVPVAGRGAQALPVASGSRPAGILAYAGAAVSTGGVLTAGQQSGSAQTEAGRVNGYVLDGIHCFRGIPYAAPPVGEGRFRPPRRPTGWSGTRTCLSYAAVAMQDVRWRNDPLSFLYAWDDGFASEDCLTLNIWTPALDNAPRPVMVWIHGGRFNSGSSHELPAYDGAALSRRGDVVVVSVNHRLGVFGFLDLEPLLGAEYAGAGNAGMLDLVAALRWVRDNIGRFGGNAGNVTIFGQSGGGWKIGALMAMPAASGLFHRAIVQSGSMLHFGSRKDSIALASDVLTAMDIQRDPHKLASVPSWKVQLAATQALATTDPGPSGTLPSRAWQPVVDGVALPVEPSSHEAMDRSGWLPMMIGTTMHEWNPAVADPSLRAMTMPQAAERLKPRLGAEAWRVLAAYQAAHPESSPLELYCLIISPRTTAIQQAILRSRHARAPTFLYWFGWKTPIWDGAPLAFHCSELPFTFMNTDRCANVTGGGPRPYALAEIMCDAWIKFARTGNPNHSKLSYWPAFATGPGQTMVFNDESRAYDDPDKVERKLIEQARRQM